MNTADGAVLSNGVFPSFTSAAICRRPVIPQENSFVASSGGRVFYLECLAYSHRLSLIDNPGVILFSLSNS